MAVLSGGVLLALRVALDLCRRLGRDLCSRTDRRDQEDLQVRYQRGLTVYDLSRSQVLVGDHVVSLAADLVAEQPGR